MTVRQLVSQEQMERVLEGLTSEPRDTSYLEALLDTPLQGKLKYACLTKDGWTLRLHTDHGLAAEAVLVIEDWNRGNKRFAAWSKELRLERL